MSITAAQIYEIFKSRMREFFAIYPDAGSTITKHDVSQLQEAVSELRRSTESLRRRKVEEGGAAMTDDLALWTARCIARALVNGNNADAIALVRNAATSASTPDEVSRRYNACIKSYNQRIIEPCPNLNPSSADY